LSLLLVLGSSAVFAQDHDDHDSHDHSELHFSHPLIVESPSPDTKVRFDYFYIRSRDLGIGTTDHVGRVQAEYAFNRAFSIEVNVPYDFRRIEFEPHQNHLDTMEVSIKAASYAFEKQKILPVYGVSFNLPTGSKTGIGSDHIVEIEPYAGLGVMRGKFEFIGFGSVGVPVNKHDGEDEGTEVGYEFSTLYKVTRHFQGLLEFDGHTALTGDKETVFNVSPGFKFNFGHHWQFGAGVGFPLTSQKEFNVRAITSVFYHF
jgi:hypothetical protein